MKNNSLTKILTTGLVLGSLGFGQAAVAEDVISYYKYNNLYQDYSEQFDKRKKIQKKYNTLIDEYNDLLGTKKTLVSKYNNLIHSKNTLIDSKNTLIDSNNNFCMKYGTDIKDLRVEVSDRIQETYTNILQVQNSDDTMDQSKLVFTLMVLNGRVEVDKSKLKIAGENIQTFSSYCNTNGTNTKFINGQKKIIADYVIKMEKVDNYLITAFKKQIGKK